MDFRPESYFGLTGFLHHMSHYLPKDELPACKARDSADAAPQTPSPIKPATQVSMAEVLWKRVQKEAIPRIACAASAYYALPVFAGLGAASQLLLCVHKAYIYMNVDKSDKHLQECSEHLLRLTYNVLIYVFRTYIAVKFLFPFWVLSWHHRIEGIPIYPGDRENRDAYIHLCARFITGLALNKLDAKDDIRIYAHQAISTRISSHWQAPNVTAVATWLFAWLPGQNKPPAPV